MRVTQPAVKFGALVPINAQSEDPFDCSPLHGSQADRDKGQDVCWHGLHQGKECPEVINPLL